MLKNLIPWFILIRPLNLLITFFSTATGYWLAGGAFGHELFLAACSASLIAAGGNVINDVYDFDIDIVNRPERPLPSKHISISNAYNYYLLLSLTGLTLSALLSYAAFGIAFLVFAGLFLYAKKTKRLPLIGNFSIAVFTGLVFPYGALAGGDLTAGYFPFLFAFLTTFIREILKDLEDAEGDALAGAKTYPLLQGSGNALKLVRLLSLLLFFSTLLPFFLHIYKIEFFILTMLIVNPMVIVANKIISQQQPGKKEYARASVFMKLSMISGLVAIVAGKL